MTKSIVTIIFTLLIATVLASPIKPRNIQKRSFKVPRIPVKNYVANGPKALKRAYAKFGLTEPAAGPAQLRKRDVTFGFGDISIVPGGDVAARINKAASNSTTGKENGETSATATQNDAQFLSPVKVGGQEIIVNFDSGSSDTYVDQFSVQQVLLTSPQMGFQHWPSSIIAARTYEFRSLQIVDIQTS